MKKKALLIIDLLNDFMHPQGALYCGDPSRRIVPVVRSLRKVFDQGEEPVVYLRDAHAPDDKEFEQFSPHAVRGTWGGEIIAELAPLKHHHVVDKTRFSGFYRTSLEQLLLDLGPDEVWVTGVCTSICVMDTVGDLRNRDYEVVVPVNAVADFDPVFHDFSLQRMERVYGVRLLEIPPER